ncbi:MAG: GIY-YIG nuclease family protein [Elusimicrobia bacterium]|nr:GIY-YIG nuclease family protein [Elusimicrobiota bacterium]
MADGGPSEWSVYIVRCVDGSFYTGVAKDVERRLGQHNAGKGAAYTRSRRPVDLRFREDGLTRSQALVREAQIKSWDRPQKEKFLKTAGSQKKKPSRRRRRVLPAGQ